MTGLQAPYETPSNPEVIVNTEEMNPQECATKIISFLQTSNSICNPTFKTK